MPYWQHFARRPLQNHLVEPALEHGELYHTVLEKLLGHIRIAKVVAQLTLQEPGDLGLGIVQVLEAAILADKVSCQVIQPRPQCRWRAVVHAVTVYVDAQVIVRLAQLTRQLLGYDRQVGRAGWYRLQWRQIGTGRHHDGCTRHRSTWRLRHRWPPARQAQRQPDDLRFCDQPRVHHPDLTPM